MKKSVLFCIPFLLAVLVCHGVPVMAQNQGSTAVGEVSYLEGTVKVYREKAWSPVKIKDKIYAGQAIQTGSDGSVEIRWINGTKTTLEANSKQDIAVLYANSAKNVKGETQGLWGKFTKLFKSKDNGKQEEGGIRRGLADVKAAPGKDELYWKSSNEVSFETATKYYENQDYAKAASALSIFIEQKPKDPRAKLALFALGHCYVEMNNPLKAREVFRKFLAEYSNDELAGDATKVLEKLQ